MKESERPGDGTRYLFIFIIELELEEFLVILLEYQVNG